MNQARSLLAIAAGCVLSHGTGAFATVIYFEVSNYRSVDDSPFKDLPEFYLEDFEDGVLNTPNVSSPSGFVLTIGDIRSVDGDDGILDGVSASFGAFASSEPVVPFHLFQFTPDEFGRYPNFVGVVVTQEPALNTPVDSYAGRSGTDTIIPSQGFNVADLVAATNDFRSVATARFVGIYSSEGIERFGVSRALQLDHLQYSYAAIPEPAPMGLLACALACAALRRRR